MTDLVGTCPRDFWQEWIKEGALPGIETDEEFGWYTGSSLATLIYPGDRFYVVALGKLRGYAPVTRVQPGCIIRRDGAVAVTIDQPIPGFRGLRKRWWRRDEEKPFPDWRTP